MIVYMYIWFKNTDIVYKCPWCGSPTISSPATWFFPVEILQKTDVPVGEKTFFLYTEDLLQTLQHLTNEPSES
jgi:hypothetical protein